MREIVVSIFLQLFDKVFDDVLIYKLLNLDTYETHKVKPHCSGEKKTKQTNTQNRQRLDTEAATLEDVSNRTFQEVHLMLGTAQ